VHQIKTFFIVQNFRHIQGKADGDFRRIFSLHTAHFLVKWRLTLLFEGPGKALPCPAAGATCYVTILKQHGPQCTSLSTGVLQGKFPVDQLVYHGVDIVRTSILIIQVVGVFPHIDGQ